MTALAITPNWKNKSAKFRGTIAAGEHVAVTIQNDDGSGSAYVTSTQNLRLNVISPATGRLLATFPPPAAEGETPETWDDDTTPLSCTLNLNTVQMLMAVHPGETRNLLFVLDDYESKTLYFKDMCEVTHWPRRVGEEEPLNLDGYRDFVEETERRLSEFSVRLEELGGQVEAAAANAEASARSAADSADSADRAMVAAQSAASTAQEIASSKADLVDGKVPSSQLPAYVDDVLEFATLSDFPSPGMEGKIYVAKDTNKTYRWSGTQYTEIANPTLDSDVTKNSANGVKSSGIWSALWGTATTAFSSLYDWCVAQLAGKASTADATLTERGFSEWNVVCSDPTVQGVVVYDDYEWKYKLYDPNILDFLFGETEPIWPEDSATSLQFRYVDADLTFVATRTALSGYILGPDKQTNPNRDKPLASEAEAEALRSGKQDALDTQQLANIAAVPDKLDTGGGTMTGVLHIPYGLLSVESGTGDARWVIEWQSAVDVWALKIKPENSDTPYYIIFPNTGGTLALTAGTGHTGNLAALDAQGNPTDAGWTAGDLARYALTTKTISNGAVTLDDRAINAVAVSSSLASLTVNFPTATSGKARDFGLRLSVASGITTAPELVLPQGITFENADGEVPEIGADGAATILYFTETTAGVFLVKGEVVTAIS